MQCNIEDQKELYGVYEEEIRGSKADYEIMRTNHLNTVDKLQGDIEGIEKELSKKNIIINGITRLRVREVETRQDLEDELSSRKEDSEVLAKVVEVLKEWDCNHRTQRSVLDQLCDIVKDYLDTPE